MATTDEMREWLEQAHTARRTSDELYWKVAEGLFHANRGEYKRRQADLAAAVGLKAQGSVSKYIWCWNHCGPAKPGDKPKKPWAEAWRESTGKTTSPRTRGAKANTSTRRPKAKTSTISASEPEKYSPGNIPVEPLTHDLPYYLRATGELIGMDYEEAVEAIPADQSSVYQEWAEQLVEWLSLFMKARERRFGEGPDESDPILTDS